MHFGYALLRYFFRVLIVVSMLFNAILGGCAGQTFSARNWYWKKEGYPNLVWAIDLFFWFDPDHCFYSWCTWKHSANLRAMSKSIDHQIDNLLETFYKCQE